MSASGPSGPLVFFYFMEKSEKKTVEGHLKQMRSLRDNFIFLALVQSNQACTVTIIWMRFGLSLCVQRCLVELQQLEFYLEPAECNLKSASCPQHLIAGSCT